MALINRMSRLITADFHAVLDRLEEPEALLRQAIREMEEELARNERKVTGLEHEQEALIARREKLDATLRELDTELDLSFDSGNEALARRLIKRKLETTRLAEHVGERLHAIEKALAARRADLSERREQLDVTRQKAEVLAESTTPREPSFFEDSAANRFVVGDDEIELALLRERQRRAQK